MANRVYNFCAGPATMPVPVLEQVQKELLDFNGTGMSILEVSHRAKTYDEVHNQAKNRIKKLLNISDDYEVLFMTGGASSQFALIPMNFWSKGKHVEYVNTGVWSKKAIAEGKVYCGDCVKIAASSEDQNFNYIPKDGIFSDDAAYLHITSNNTIVGTQYRVFPKTRAPLIADMSSDILSKPVEVSKFDLIYAGAQKNCGPTGVTLVIVKRSFIEDNDNESLPTIFRYRTHLAENSLYNTPPAFAIYMVGLVMEWLEGQGGVAGIEKKNREKAGILYERLDRNDFYQGTAKAEDRSLMNVPFRLRSETLEKQFLGEAEAAGLSGLKGHRLVGGCRASIYNAFPKEGVIRLVEFMEKFERERN